MSCVGIWTAWSVAVGVVQASADMQGTLSLGQGGAAAEYSQSYVVGLQQAATGTAGTPDNMTAQVVTLERLAHDLQQHLAGE